MVSRAWWVAVAAFALAGCGTASPLEDESRPRSATAHAAPQCVADTSPAALCGGTGWTPHPDTLNTCVKTGSTSTSKACAYRVFRYGQYQWPSEDWRRVLLVIGCTGACLTTALESPFWTAGPMCAACAGAFMSGIPHPAYPDEPDFFGHQWPMDYYGPVQGSALDTSLPVWASSTYPVTITTISTFTVR
jgi:hypothetical protein